MQQLTNPIKEALSFIRNTDIWYWGKAATVDAEHVEMLLCPVTCKDYIVDNLYQSRRSMNQTKEYLSTKERNENCIYVFFPSKKIASNVINNVVNFLNPWFAENGIAPTTIEQATWDNGRFNNSLYIIKGDNKWTENCFGWSIYLSILRILGMKDGATKINFQPENPDYYPNEYHYCNQWKNTNAPKILAKLDEIFNNPFPYLDKYPKGYKITGYPDNVDAYHGETGPFYLLQMIYGNKQFPSHYKNSQKLKHYFFEKFSIEIYPKPVKTNASNSVKSPAVSSLRI